MEPGPRESGVACSVSTVMVRLGLAWSRPEEPGRKSGPVCPVHWSLQVAKPPIFEQCTLHMTLTSPDATPTPRDPRSQAGMEPHT